MRPFLMIRYNLSIRIPLKSKVKIYLYRNLLGRLNPVAIIHFKEEMKKEIIVFFPLLFLWWLRFLLLFQML
jgi:hypothetical protein